MHPDMKMCSVDDETKLISQKLPNLQVIETAVFIQHNGLAETNLIQAFKQLKCIYIHLNYLGGQTNT